MSSVLERRSRIWQLALGCQYRRSSIFLVTMLESRQFYLSALRSLGRLKESLYLFLLDASCDFFFSSLSFFSDQLPFYCFHTLLYSLARIHSLTHTHLPTQLGFTESLCMESFASILSVFSFASRLAQARTTSLRRSYRAAVSTS